MHGWWRQKGGFVTVCHQGAPEGSPGRTRCNFLVRKYLFLSQSDDCLLLFSLISGDCCCDYKTTWQTPEVQRCHSLRRLNHCKNSFAFTYDSFSVFDLSSKVGWKWKWSNGVGKSEMIIIWSLFFATSLSTLESQVGNIGLDPAQLDWWDETSGFGFPEGGEGDGGGGWQGNRWGSGQHRSKILIQLSCQDWWIKLWSS